MGGCVGINSRTRKLLWGRARNECAFPGCTQSLTEDLANLEAGSLHATVVGEEAHIRAQSPGGARHDPTYEDVDGYENLILMCPTHHTFIDANEGHGFSVVRLLEMKREHEAEQSKSVPRQRALRAYLGDRYSAENTIQFQQVDLRGPSVDSMFVDVPVACRQDEAAVAELFAEIVDASPGDTADLEDISGMIVAGATQVLLHPKWTGNAVLVGGPGQGKSTVLQFICQFHRARSLGKSEYTARRSGLARDATVGRFPIRIDLRRYAEWAVSARDSHRQKRHPKERSRPEESSWRSLEEYIIEDIQAHIGANSFDAEDFAAVIAQEPVLLALDGLDEVASVNTRSRVSQEISAVHGRLTADAADLIIIVATRPGGSLQPLTGSGFPVLHLQKLTQGLRLQYLRRWVEVSQLSADAGERLQSTFMDSQHVAHINELASYPMQLAILLHLLHRRQLLPEQRTDLYREYLKTFLDREQTEDKEPLLDEQRRVMEDTHAFLGWYLQAKAEQGDSSGAITRSELRTVLRDHLAGQPEEQELAESIYSAITDRVLCLVERNGAFEFEVQSLREYFAALHIFENLTARGDGNSRDDGLDALLERPYWANVCRFFVGMLARGEIRAFRGNLDVAGQRAEPHPLVRGMAVHVLSDRIYNGQPDPEIRKVVNFILDGPGLLLAEDGTLDSSGSPLRFGHRAGRAQAVEHLKSRLNRDLPRPLASAAAASLEAHASEDDDIAGWWWSRFHPTQTWLEVGARLGALRAPDSEQTELLRKAIKSDPGDAHWHLEGFAAGDYRGDDSFILATAQTELNAGAADVLRRPGGPSRLSSLISESLAAVSGRALPVPGPRRAVFATGETALHDVSEPPSSFDLSRSLAAVAARWGDGWVLRRAVGQVPSSMDIQELGAYVTNEHLGTALLAEGGYREYRADAKWWQATLGRTSESSERALVLLALLRRARARVIIDLSTSIEQTVAALTPKHYRALERILWAGHQSAATRRVNLEDAFRLKQVQVDGPTLWLLWIVGTEASRSRISRQLPERLGSIFRSGISDGRRALEAASGERKLQLQTFEHTRLVFPNGARANPDSLTAMSPSLARSALRQPENWPAEIVQLAADRIAGQIADATPPLAELASTNNWFRTKD